jgi:hypothetical protein
MLLFLILGLLASIAHAIPTITAKGSKFFTSDGNQFFLKGMLSFLVYSATLRTDFPHKALLTSSCLKTHSSTTTSAPAMPN